MVKCNQQKLFYGFLSLLLHWITVAASYPHDSSGSKYYLSSDESNPVGMNENGSVKLFGAGCINVTLGHPHELQFEVCKNNCLQKSIVCYCDSTLIATKTGADDFCFGVTLIFPKWSMIHLPLPPPPPTSSSSLSVTSDSSASAGFFSDFWWIFLILAIVLIFIALGIAGFFVYKKTNIFLPNLPRPVQMQPIETIATEAQTSEPRQKDIDLKTTQFLKGSLMRLHNKLMNRKQLKTLKHLHHLASRLRKLLLQNVQRNLSSKRLAKVLDPKNQRKPILSPLSLLLVQNTFNTFLIMVIEKCQCLFSWSLLSNFASQKAMACTRRRLLEIRAAQSVAEKREKMSFPINLIELAYLKNPKNFDDWHAIETDSEGERQKKNAEAAKKPRQHGKKSKRKSSKKHRH